MTLRKAPNLTLTTARQVVDLSKTEPEPCAVKLQNESPYTLDLTIGPDVHTLTAWTADVYPVPAGVTQITVSPVSLIGTTPVAVLLITTAGAGDVIPGTYPVALVRQSSTYGLFARLIAPAALNDTVVFVDAPQMLTPAMGVIFQKADGSGNANNGVKFGVQAVNLTTGAITLSNGLLAALAVGDDAVPVDAVFQVGPAFSEDITDRVGRLLGVIASITAAVDVSDRAARLLGVIASITATVTTDPSDRAARLLGAATTGSRQNILPLAQRGNGIYDVTIQNAIGGSLDVFVFYNAGPGNVTVDIQDIDQGHDVGISILASTALTGNARLRIAPGLTAVANATANDMVGGDVRIRSTVAGGNTTFSVDAAIFP